MTTVDPADTALLVARALRRGSTLLAALVTGAVANYGVSLEAGLLARGVGPTAAHAVALQRAGVALGLGLVSVLVLHLVVALRARRRLADQVEREWAVVEPRWSRRRTL